MAKEPPGPWEEEASESEKETHVSRNISLRSFPSAFRLGQPSPLEAPAQVGTNYTPYRGGGSSIQHGVPQLYTPSPPDKRLEPTPHDSGPTIGGEDSAPALRFPEPQPVRVVEMPQATNSVPLGRTAFQRLPPRVGATIPEAQQAIPTVVPIIGREQQRTKMWAESDNHEEEEPGDPYCVHMSFDREFRGRSFPLMSNGNPWGPHAHTEGVFGANTESFAPEGFEYYKSLDLYQRMMRKHVLIMGETFDPDKPLQAYAQEAERMDFLAVVEESKWRTFHLAMEYSAEVA